MVDKLSQDDIRSICEQCSRHDVLQQQVNYNYHRAKEQDEKHESSLKILSDNLIEANEKISKRIPIVHFLTLLGSIVAIIVFLIGIQINSNKETEDKMLQLLKTVTETRVIVEQHQQQDEKYNKLLEEIKKLRSDL